MNIIKNWSYETPTEEGLYLVCCGDVETPENVTAIEARMVNGELTDGANIVVSNYHGSYKFARLVFSPSEIEGVSDEL